jgi:hypothetical protein
MVMKRHRVLIRRPALERAQPQSYISTCRSGLLELKARKGSQKCVRSAISLWSGTRRGRPRVAIGWRVTGVLKLEFLDRICNFSAVTRRAPHVDDT